MVARRRRWQVADVGVVRLPAVGVVGARPEVDGLVAVAPVDVVVRAGLWIVTVSVPLPEVDVVVRPGADGDGVVSVADDDAAVRTVADGHRVVAVTESRPRPSRSRG